VKKEKEHLSKKELAAYLKKRQELDPQKYGHIDKTWPREKIVKAVGKAEGAGFKPLTVIEFGIMVVIAAFVLFSKFGCQ